VRATVLDAHSYGFHTVIAEEACFDRNLLSHKVNLFDLHHKYADVMKTSEIVAHLDSTANKGP
jgi:isochorismate hydrolase